MSKRRGQEIETQHRSSSQYRYRKKHLYLVLDDWRKGFTVHKIDADSFDSSNYHDDDPAGDAGVAGYLTEPPAIRLQAPGDDANMSFLALGSKIFIVTDKRSGQTPAVMFDTETSALGFGPRVPSHLQLGFNVVVPAGGALYAFAPPLYNGRTCDVMSWKPSALDHYDHEDPDEEAWRWRSLPGPPRPFERLEVIRSYAVHPDERTIFMTTSYNCTPGYQKSTFSFNTRSRVWKWHAWALPFLGPGVFDRELDAWVGLRWDGYVCACRVPTDRGSTSPVNLGQAQLDWQVLENEVFCRDFERDMGSSLTYMGDSKFCFVKIVMNKVDDERGFVNRTARDGCVLHMTVFGLKYNHRGELRAKTRWSKRSFLVPKHKDRIFAPEAFWM